MFCVPVPSSCGDTSAVSSVQVISELSLSHVLGSVPDCLWVTVALGSELSVRLRTRELCEDPRALATAASLLCWLMRCSKLPAAPLDEVGVVLNHGREEIS